MRNNGSGTQFLSVQSGCSFCFFVLIQQQSWIRLAIFHLLSSLAKNKRALSIGENLSHGAESLLEVSLKRTLLVQVLDVASIGLETTGSALSDVVLTGQLGETPLLGDDDLLATSKLELGTTESLDDNSLVGILGTDREDDLTNVDTGSSSQGLTPGTTHTGLKTISTGTGQHLVDTQHVEGVKTDTHVEGVLSGGLGDVLVAANATSLQGLGRDLLLLVAQQVDTERELVNTGLLTTQIVDTDLGV